MRETVSISNGIAKRCVIMLHKMDDTLDGKFIRDKLISYFFLCSSGFSYQREIRSAPIHRSIRYSKFLFSSDTEF
jgi:hypothetical protein